MSKARNLLLTESQAACLMALRNGKGSLAKIAVEAKLDLTKAVAALRMLAGLGLAAQDRAKRWDATPRGKNLLLRHPPGFKAAEQQFARPRRRLLELLDRPMRGSEIVEKLGMSRQGVSQLLINLHACGRVRFADPDNPLWLVTRASDKTSMLSQ